MSSQPVMLPQVTQLPSSSSPNITPRTSDAKSQLGVPGEFGRILDSELGETRAPLKFSAHAHQRIMERKIPVSPELMNRVNRAIDLAAAKGIEESLILSKDAAFIVSVKNRTVVTAMDPNQLVGNIFTNIDGAMVI